VRGLREQPVRDVADYRDERWWAGDIPDHPSCVVTPTGAEPWLRVSKAQVSPPPTVPTDIESYLTTGATDPENDPAFAEDFDETFQGSPDEAERLTAVLRDYVDGPWRAWTPAAKVALKARELYDALFHLRLRLQRDSALIELVWGHGILSWTVNGTRIVHPLITTQVQLSFDAESGSITVEPEALVPHRMDLDLLQGLKLDGFDLLLDVRDGFRNAPVGPFDPENRILYEKLLTPLSQDGSIVDAAMPVTPDANPRITATWVLMVRRRSTLYRRFFGELRDALMSGELDVPAPLVAVVADEPGRLNRESIPDDDQSWHRGAERLLMPLPTNPEQEAVARRLAEHRGVTVQGPARHTRSPT
jgi:hypothetical protein